MLDPDILAPRRANVEDLLDVAKIHRLAFFEAMPEMPVLHTPAEDLNFYTTGVFPSEEIWLAQRFDSIVGFIAFRPGWVDHLYVHPNCQRRGIGTILLAEAQKSASSLRLWTFRCNQRARRFYEKHGFRIEKETDGAGNEEKQPDVLYVWKRENAAPIPSNFEAIKEPATPTVRRATPADAVAAAKLLTTAGYLTDALVMERRMVDCAEDGRSAVFVAECAGRIVGLLSFHCVPQFHSEGFLGCVTSVVVAPEHRRRGIGRMLVSAGEKFGWSRRCTRIEITSGDHRKDAQAFYQRLGYQSDSLCFVKRGSGL